MDAVVVYGPQGCGKTRNAEALRQFYGKARVLDDWTSGDDLPADALALTHQPGIPGAIAFDAALAASRAGRSS